ncbi:MAG TPA: ABC transporter ATP-binding protein [Planktothrix sp.]
MVDAPIQVIDVTKSFAGTVAVKSINLAVEKAEFFSFLGPSGCGKTTLLRMIAGFETPTSGRILIAGKDMANIPAHKRPVNMVFQSYALFPHLDVIENICFGLRSARRFSKNDMYEKAKRALSLVRLEHLSNRFPSQLSGGQQQRIALARAIVNEPAVLLLDEPLSALDPQIREEMQTELARLQRELNMTFIMVTHDQDEALALSHRIAVFCQGNLEQVGNPESIYMTPRTRFVAEFIGQSNLLDCTYVQSSRGLHTVRLPDGTECSITGLVDFSAKSGDACLLTIKPQAIEIRMPSSAALGDNNEVSGRIAFASYKGTSTEYFVHVGGKQLRVDRQNRGIASSFKSGDSVTLSFPPEAGWLLANDTTPSASPTETIAVPA